MTISVPTEQVGHGKLACANLREVLRKLSLFRKLVYFNNRLLLVFLSMRKLVRQARN